MSINNSLIAMQPLFELCADDLDPLLPHMKMKLMSGTESAQVRVVEEIATFLKRADEGSRGAVVRKLVRFNVISTVCEVLQTAEEGFVRTTLECLELMSNHEEFYEDYTAVCATESMLRLSYCINRSLTRLLEELVHGVCNVLVRSSKFAVNFDAICVPRQVVLFLKTLDIQNSARNRLRFAAVAMLNVLLQRAVFDEDDTAKLLIDVCRDALKSMTDIVKYGEDEDDDTTLRAVALLCGTCNGASRFCNIDTDEDSSDEILEARQTRADLLTCIYSTTISVIVPYVKDSDWSRIDSIEFHRNLVSCFNNLYQLRNCDHDDLSNHLAANGYLKYFLRLTVQLPEKLHRVTCVLLSRILSILGKTAFCKDTTTFANTLRQGLLQLSKDPKRWNDAVAHYGEDGTALTILLYYHFHGTRENDTVSLQSLIARIVSLQKSAPISVLILKPLWFLFAVTSLSHPRPYLISNYTNAVRHLTSILQRFELSEFYTHHIDLLRYCLECPDIPQNFVNQVLDLWLIESDGDIKPLLSFNRDKVIRRLLIVLQAGYSESIINLAAKALGQVIEIYKADKGQIDEIAEIVWYMLPNILMQYNTATVVHIEAVLELANIIQPHTISIHLITRSADIIANIILKKKKEDSKLMTLIVTQAYILLVAAMARKSFKVLEIYIENSSKLLKILYAYGFAKDRSQLCAISIKLLAFIIYCQKKTLITCKKPLGIHIKNLVDLLMRVKTSPYCSISGMQLVLELLTQKTDSPAIVLQNIGANVDALINLYELLHVVHIQKDLTQKDLIYQCLVALLDFCDAKVAKLLPHLCTVMSNYDLVSNVVNMRFVSCYFVDFVVTWLRYRKANCKDVPWNSRSLFKAPFDEVLDQLKEYSALVNEKGLKDAYLSLQDALSQFSSEQ